MQWTDEFVDRIIGALLRFGVTVSAAVVLAGGVWYLAGNGASVPDYHVFHGEPAAMRSVSGVLREAWRPLGLIQLGLLLLMATPVARVAFSVFAFAVQKDRAYVAVTLIVLAVLVFSLSGAGH